MNHLREQGLYNEFSELATKIYNRMLSYISFFRFLCSFLSFDFYFFPLSYLYLCISSILTILAGENRKYDNTAAEKYFASVELEKHFYQLNILPFNSTDVCKRDKEEGKVKVKVKEEGRSAEVGGTNKNY